MAGQDLLYHTVKGEGYPVVFIHGFLESDHIWENLTPILEKVKAIRVELPGHGKSKLLSKDLTLDNIAEEVFKVVQHLGIDKFSIVGHSMGGYTALAIANLYPDNVEHAVLFHSHPWADSEERKVNRTRAAKIVDYDKMLFLKEAIPHLYRDQIKFESQINRSLDIAFQMSEEAINQSLYAMRDRSDRVDVLKRMGEKLHIIQGEFDPLIDTIEIAQAAKENGNTYNLIKGIGHNGYDESPEEVISHLSFLLQL